MNSNGLFTHEEFNTFITQVESILNYDPNNLQALTPGHFLIGRPLTELPEHDFSNISTNRLSSWQDISKIKRDFRVHKHEEYLNELNIRHKWTKGQHLIKKESIVILRKNNTLPAQWIIGRIIKTHPGTGNIVDVKTSTNCYRHNMRKLTPLTINMNTVGANHYHTTQHLKRTSLLVKAATTPQQQSNRSMLNNLFGRWHVRSYHLLIGLTILLIQSLLLYSFNLWRPLSLQNWNQRRKMCFR